MKTYIWYKVFYKDGTWSQHHTKDDKVRTDSEIERVVRMIEEDLEELEVNDFLTYFNK